MLLASTAVTNVYRARRDLFLAQGFARHMSPLTTRVYTQLDNRQQCSLGISSFGRASRKVRAPD
jgi:hypothetical protein